MPPKRFSTLSIAAAGLAALAVAGCGGDEQDDTTTTPAAAQAPAATGPGATTPAATAPAKPAPTATAPGATATAPGATATAPGATASAPVRESKPVALAVATTNRQAGALAFTMKGTVTTGGQPAPLSARGVYDRKSRRGAFTTKTKIGAQAFTVRQIADGQMVYLRSPVYAGKLPGGKSWLKIDVAQAARVPGLDLDALGVGGPSKDPAQGLDYLRGAGTATRLGTAKVNGVATTRYRVQVDLKRAAKRSAKGTTARRSIDRLIASLGGPTMLPVDVWIDGDHLVRRQHVKYSATVSGARSAFDITTDYTAYGATIDAKPPADGDTFDGLESLKRAAEARKEAQGSQQAPQG
jgi:hypothetical protein